MLQFSDTMDNRSSLKGAWLWSCDSF